jgi:F-type H+-transporting ATPase subunit O
MLLSSAARSVSTARSVGSRAASSISSKYSKAIYSAALKKSPQTLTKVHTELNAIATSISQQPEISSFLHNPTLSVQERKTALSGLFTKLESNKQPVSEITKNLLLVLSENGRLGETEGVIEGFNELVAQYRGELNVVVTSATPLAKDVLTRLETSLKQSQAGQQAKVLKLTNKASKLYWEYLHDIDDCLQVNPSILGGLVVDFGEKTIDLSVQSRVTKLNNVLQRTLGASF